MFCNISSTKNTYNTSQHSPIHTQIHTQIQAASLQSVKLLIRNSHTHIHTPVEQPSGAIWGSVSCSRTLQHAHRSPGDQTTNPLIGPTTRSLLRYSLLKVNVHAQSSRCILFINTTTSVMLQTHGSLLVL